MDVIMIEIVMGVIMEGTMNIDQVDGTTIIMVEEMIDIETGMVGGAMMARGEMIETKVVTMEEREEREEREAMG